ncbi:pepsin-like aspartic protease [Celerinatantimonas sp. YJH-8]|uniref:pepsin-like aspartic protease n=1 Tax=Celerinatantimonas sp. YJH-8 TaxID=3228714 RepID=UPI0038C15F6D
MNDPSSSGLSLTLFRGPYQSNGATPWYAQIGIGTPPQILKIALDTGSNFNWVSSGVSPVADRQHYGGLAFNSEYSSTFKLQQPDHPDVDFGPWGTMSVEQGADRMSFPVVASVDASAITTLDSELYLSKKYSGNQFQELNWDGGLGLPSYSSLPSSPSHQPIAYRGIHRSREDQSFHFVESLLEAGIMDPSHLWIAFETDAATNQGTVSFGQLDPRYCESHEYLFLPWQKSSVESLYYVWTSEFQSMTVGQELICASDSAHPYYLCLDSGSSLFKGDPTVMQKLLEETTRTGDVLTIDLGPDDKGLPQQLAIPSDVYQVTIEAGDHIGETFPQFQPMQGLEQIALVGSVLMDHLYTVYQYQMGANGAIEPKGIWLFNKLGGVPIIQTQQPTSAAIFS